MMVAPKKHACSNSFSALPGFQWVPTAGGRIVAAHRPARLDATLGGWLTSRQGRHLGTVVSRLAPGIMRQAFSRRDTEALRRQEKGRDGIQSNCPQRGFRGHYPYGTPLRLCASARESFPLAVKEPIAESVPGRLTEPPHRNHNRLGVPTGNPDDPVSLVGNAMRALEPLHSVLHLRLIHAQKQVRALPCLQFVIEARQ